MRPSIPFTSRFANRAVALAVAVCLVGMTNERGAHAADREQTGFSDPEARAAFVEGVRQMGLGNHDAAIAAFEAGYARVPVAGFLYNIALAYRQKGACAEAARAYRLYLERDPDAANRDKVERRVLEMDLCAERAANDAARPGTGLPGPDGPRPAPAPGPVDAPAPLPPVQPPRAPVPVWVPGLLTGVGLGLALGGAAWEIVLDRQYAGLRDECSPVCLPSRYDGLRGQEIGAYVMVGVGAAVLVTGATWLIVRAHGDRQRRVSTAAR